MDKRRSLIHHLKKCEDILLIDDCNSIRFDVLLDLGKLFVEIRKAMLEVNAKCVAFQLRPFLAFGACEYVRTEGTACQNVNIIKPSCIMLEEYRDYLFHTSFAENWS